MNIKIKDIILLFVSLLVFSVNTTALDESAAREIDFVNMELITWKYSDDTRALIATLIAENEEGEYAAEGFNVIFFVIGEDRVILAETISDKHGQAIALFPPDFVFPMDEEGYINIIAEFEGDDGHEMAEAELAFKNVSIEIAFEIEDEERMILFAGQINGPDGKKLPLADDDIYFYVPRMFSDLKIAEGWFEEDGTGYVEFPNDIIGDSLGRIKVIARLEEHFDYGNVEKTGIIDWAIPWHPMAREGPGRELWTPVAPLWMIITLIVSLVGVWGHYFYAIYQLYLIKKSSRRNS